MGPTKTLLTVQALRAIAAASVVVHHVLWMLIHNAGYSFRFWSGGSAGVDLFFCISGFVMIYAHAEDFGVKGAPAAFVRRRVTRIAPLYWVVTTIVVALLVVVPRLFPSVTFEWTNVFCSYAFLLSRTSAGTIGTVTQTGWTLCFEAYFYLVFAVLLLLPRRYFLLTAGVIFGCGLLFGIVHPSVPPFASVAVRPLLIEFYFGAVIAFLFMRGLSLPLGAALLAIVVGIVAIPLTEPANDWWRVLFYGGGSALILTGAISIERFGVRVPKLLVALGASSYSLYLVHPLFVPAFGKAWALAGFAGIPAFVPAVIAFVLALALGHGVYLWVEKPLTAWCTRTWPRPAMVAKAVA